MKLPLEKTRCFQIKHRGESKFCFAGKISKSLPRAAFLARLARAFAAAVVIKSAVKAAKKST